MEQPRIALLCGGRFAFPSLQLLMLEKFLCGVVIGGAEKESVKLLEEGLGQAKMPFLSVGKASEMSALAEWLKEVKPDAVFSICFPYRLPAEILALHPERFINFHTGPLPSYRGAMPIFEVLRAGEKSSAIAVHIMSENFDEGDLIFSEPVPVKPDDTFGSLAVRLSDRCSHTALNMAQMLEFGSGIPRQAQSQDESRYFPKPGKSDTFIRWSFMGAEEICRLVNACNPWNNGADTVINNRPLKIIAAGFADETHGKDPGTILSRDASAMRIACIDNQVLLVHILSDENGINGPARFPSFLGVNQRFSG